MLYPNDAPPDARVGARLPCPYPLSEYIVEQDVSSVSIVVLVRLSQVTIAV